MTEIHRQPRPTSPRPHLVLPGSTSQGSASLPGLSLGVQSQLRSRLRLVAAMMFGLFAVASLLLGAFGWLTSPSPSDLTHPLEANKPITLLLVLVSGGVWVLVGRVDWPPRRLSNLAIAYEIALALLIGLSRHSLPQSPEFVPIGFSPACIIIVMFPLIVPNTARRTLIAGLLTASMEVAAFLYWQSTGMVTPTPLGVTFLLAPNFACAVLAVVPARIIHQLDRDVQKARELGAYRLVEKLGQGGMGEVWRGEHSMLARAAAIKVVRPESLSQDAAQASLALQRFEREAQATAGLHSPHTIQLFDFGYTEEGAFYYVMELLDGLDLDALVEQHGPLPAERVVFLLLQLADSLDDAHKSGLVHRDIKPANIYACRYGHRDDFVKVLDFGLVKRHAEPDRAATKLTAEGVIAGTPAFLAPELATNPDATDARADLYAVGCVAYWLLTGQLVFAADSPMQMLIAHLKDPPVPPSLRTELDVPLALERIVLDCLAKSPEARPASAEELFKRLDETGLAKAWTRERARQWWDVNVPRGARPATQPEPARRQSLETTAVG